MGSCNQGVSTKCRIHGKRLCCTTQERRYHDCSIGGYDTCAQPIRCKCMSFQSQVCYVYDVLGVLLKMIQDDRIWQSYVQCGMMLWHLLTSSLLSFLLLKSLFSFFDMATMRNAQTKIAIVYMQEQSCDTRDDMIPRWYQYDMVCMQ